MCWDPVLLVTEHASFLSFEPSDGIVALHMHLDVAKLHFS